MKAIKILLVILLFSATSFAQTKGAIHGKLLDSADRSPLEFATVAVVEPKDSSLLAYTLAVKDGSFTLRNLPAERNLKLVISFVGYKAFRKTLFLKKGETEEFGEILLSSKGMLSDVIVQGERQAILVKKDTIEFAPEAFKTRPNAVLEDLLKKLPGLQVDLDGTITVNGKKVTKITLGGKDFFASDITVASKNINVDLIDKVQVLTDRENDPDNTKDENDLDKVINIKLKKAIKKSVFGKVYAGGGSASRFESGGLVNMFRDTLQISLIGFGNNLNRSAFSSADLNKLGGFGRSGTSTYSSGVDFGGRSYGLQQVASAGFNINYDWKKKGKANLMYFYGGTGNDYESESSSERILAGSSRFSSGFYQRDDSQRKHNLSGLYEYKFNKNNTFRFKPSFNYTKGSNTSESTGNSWNSLGDTISISSGNTGYNSNSFNYGHVLTFYRKLKKKDHSLNFTHNLSLNPENNTRITNTSATTIDSTGHRTPTTLDQRVRSEEATHSADAVVNYHSPVGKKLSSDLEGSFSYKRSVENVGTYNINPVTLGYDVFISTRSNDLRRNQYIYSLKQSFAYKISKTKTFRIAGVLQYQDVQNQFSTITNINRNYLYLLPSASYSDKGLSFSYNMRRNLPYISQLQPVSSVYSVLYTRVGNPDLKPSTENTLNLSYYKSIPAAQIDFNNSTYFTLEDNAVNSAEVVDLNTNATFSKPVNINGRVYASEYFNFSKRFKKTKNLQFRFNMNLNGSFTRMPFYLSPDSNFYDDKDFQYRYNFTIRPSVSLSYKEFVDFEPGFSLNRSINDYKVHEERNRSYYTAGLNNMLAFHIKNKVNIEFNHSYSYNSQIGKGMPKTNNLLNGSLSVKMLKKDRGELKLTGYDLLDQNNGVYTYGSEGTIYFGNQLVLHRYFMLGYVYNFNRTVTK